MTIRYNEIPEESRNVNFSLANFLKVSSFFPSPRILSGEKKKIDNEKYGAGKPICFYFILSLFFLVVKTLEVLFVGKKPSLSKETVTLYVTEGFQAYLATVWNLKYVYSRFKYFCCPLET